MGIVETARIGAQPAERQVMRVFRDGKTMRERAAIQEESLFDLYVNGGFAVRLACSASHLEELVVGRLRTEGLIAAADMMSLSLDPLRARIDVMVAQLEGAVRSTGLHSVKALVGLDGERLPLVPVTPAAYSREAVFRVAEEFALDKTEHARTRGAHSAYLCDLDGRVLCLREDVGRHNAFDKVVGWALSCGVDLRRCMLYTSGRVPADMAVKAVRAGIPVLVSKSVATDCGIDLARRYRLTLICEAKPGQFDLVNDSTCTM